MATEICPDRLAVLQALGTEGPAVFAGPFLWKSTYRYIELPPTSYTCQESTDGVDYKR
jgi:hypothetical protein